MSITLQPLTTLIEQSIQGNRDAQFRLYNLFAPKMFGVCLRFSQSREDAEDVLQEGFVQVFRSLKGFRFDGSFEGWVRRIIVNACIAHYRGRGKLPVVEARTAPDKEMPETANTTLQYKDLLKLVRDLPPAYRIVFNLHVFEGMKHREIADLLGITEGTSKSNFFDARLILKNKLNKISIESEKHG